MYRGVKPEPAVGRYFNLKMHAKEENVLIQCVHTITTPQTVIYWDFTE
jgi:hypothetical protein